MARKPVFGPIIYEAVEREHAKSGTPKSEIFQMIAANKEAYGLKEMTGKHGSVAASYYRARRTRGKSDGETVKQNENGNGASASVPPLNPARPGVRVDGAAQADGATPEALAQQLTAQIEGLIQDAVENAVAPLIAERDEAVKQLTQIKAALGQ